jgi:hypothetical protein
MTAGTIWQIVGVSFSVLFLAADAAFLRWAWKQRGAHIDGQVGDSDG